MFCPECGAELLDNDKFCIKCGVDLQNYTQDNGTNISEHGDSHNNLCPNCGAELQNDDYFCINCGMDLQKKELTHTHEAPASKNTSNTAIETNHLDKGNLKNKKYIFFFAIVVTIAVAVILIKSFSGGNHVSTAVGDNSNESQPTENINYNSSKNDTLNTIDNNEDINIQQEEDAETIFDSESLNESDSINNRFENEEEMFAIDIKTGDYTRDNNHHATIFVDDDYTLMCIINLFEEGADYEFICNVDKSGPIHNCVITDDIDAGLKSFIGCKFTINGNGDNIIIDSDDPKLSFFCGDYTYGSNSYISDATDNIADENAYYILPNSKDVMITEEALKGLTAKELTYARNEIYARHGYIFKSNELNTYFRGMSWYLPVESNDSIKLTDIEKDNMSLIANYQKNNGLEYNPQ